MIFVWLKQAFLFMCRMIVPPPSAPPAPPAPVVLSLRTPCPACGSLNRGMKYVVIDPKVNKRASSLRKGLMQRTCFDCGAYSYDQPLYDRPGGMYAGTGQRISVDHVGSQTEIAGLPN